MMVSVAPRSTSLRTQRAKEPYILLVDDHEPSLSQLDELVSRSGYACVSAHSGTEALLCCDERPPRVVVTDLSMPNLDGLALARWLQARHPSVPIILLTGQSFDPRSLGELKRTFTAVLRKPLAIEPFLALIDRLMPVPSKRERNAGRT
jgi:CheY-like chemotaxis protein